jgi:hypothetical protein
MYCTSVRAEGEAVRTHSGFSDPLADAIWNEHLGNNAFVTHRDQCPKCLAAYHAKVFDKRGLWCSEGDRIFVEMIDDVYDRIDESLTNRN